MKEMGLSGVRRGRHYKATTKSDDTLHRPSDLVEREFSAPAPNRLWVADLTYVKTHSGWVYVAFIVDVFSRMVVGWQISTSLRSDLSIDALEMAIHSRQHRDLSQVIHHSDRGVQYLSIRYTERLGDADIVASVGSRGDSYDNALAESFNGQFKAELIHRKGPWRNISTSSGPRSPTSIGSSPAHPRVTRPRHAHGVRGRLLWPQRVREPGRFGNDLVSRKPVRLQTVGSIDSGSSKVTWTDLHNP